MTQALAIQTSFALLTLLTQSINLEPVDEAAIEELYARIGQRLRAARRSKRISQDAVAAALGMSRASITNFECGRQRLSLHSIYEYAEFVDQQPIDLFPTLPELSNRADHPRVSVKVGERDHELPGHHAEFVLSVLRSKEHE